MKKPKNNDLNKCYVSKVEIHNFWGEKNISMNFANDVNFIIGRNGSGKTTLINMIAATLEGNYKFLQNSQFDKIILTLAEINSTRRPVIEVEKFNNNSDELIKYTIRQKKSDSDEEAIKIGFDGDTQYLIGNKSEGNHENADKLKFPIKRKEWFLPWRDPMLLYNKNLFQEHLFKFYNLCWLSIHRSRVGRSNRDKDFDSTVDQKLDELSANFTRYFSKLSNLAAKKKEEFQRELFLSLPTVYEQSNLIDAVLNVEERQNEKSDLAIIYEKFEIPEAAYKPKLNKFFESYENVTKEWKEKSSLDLDWEKFSILFSMQKIHEIVEKWQETKEAENLIYNSKDEFLKVLNTMLLRKEIVVNNENVLEVAKGESEKFPINALSSGEKQLLILFGEALLQEAKNYIFIADEPELSLHVDWQEQLVKNIRLINPNAQMIIATHSPDIISDYRDKAQDIENLLS